jgi:phenylalanine ammonia-lyase
MSTTTSLPQSLIDKVHAVLPAPALPKRFDESTPRTTPPLSPSLHAAVNQHDEQLLLATQLLDSTASTKAESVVALDGFKLTLGEVVAAARHHKRVKIDDAPAIKARIDESVDFLRSKVSSTAPRH